MAERMVEANGVELCTEAFGDPADPPVLLVMGSGGSMLWWDEGFCRLLADDGRFVIRYDHRDTGRSVTYEPGSPGYTGADLVSDAAGVLDAHGIPAAHVVGVSMGGALAQLLALDFPGHVRSLVLISTTQAVTGGRGGLPPPTAAFSRFAATATVDWTDRDSVSDYLVEYSRVLAGGRRPFDEARLRELVRRDVERARSFAAAQNHDALPDDERSREPLSSIAVPTLVVHGTADPLFPFPHGEALADEIPGARLLALEDAGHGVERADWDLLLSWSSSTPASRRRTDVQSLRIVDDVAGLPCEQRSDLPRNVARQGEQPAHRLVSEIGGRVEHARAAAVDHLDAVRAAVLRGRLRDAARPRPAVHPDVLDAKVHTLAHRLVGDLRPVPITTASTPLGIARRSW